jgi:ABC-type Fe3+ transport system substrate-binding protein
MTIRWQGVTALLIASVWTLPAQALTFDEILTYKGSDRQKVLEDGAAKEGTVMLYSAMIVDQALRPIADGFKKRHPNINIQFWRGEAGQIVTKVNTEVRAKALVADVAEGSGLSGAAAETQIVAPFYSKEFENLPKNYVAANSTWATTRFRYIAVGYNTKLVPTAEAPKTYEDLLKPKWKGKMAWNANSDASGAMITITSLRRAWGEKKAEDYLAKLAKQDVIPLSLSNRAVVDRVIQGEYAIGLGISAHHPLISANKGAPTATVMMDPVPALTGAVQVLKGAPHPHAAMLLVDFMLSPEAGAILQQAEYFPANPKAEPVEMLKSIIPRNAGVSEQLIAPEMLVTDTPRSAELLQQLFK